MNENYYEARGFSVYYLANIVFNIVSTPGPYIRGIEEILGDMKTEFLMQPFTRHTNLHEFIRCVSIDVITEDVEREDGNTKFIQEFFKAFDVPYSASELSNSESMIDFITESNRFHDAIDEFTDEVFHVLFNDVGFLQKFSQLCAGYIENSGFGQTLTTRSGRLKRTAIPIWVRRAIFHRDKGECRSCKRSLAAIINRLDTERYDHIVPLAHFGPNDLTNLQLLCEACNLKKSAKLIPVSRLYQRAIVR